MIKYIAALMLLVAVVSIGLYYDLSNIIDRVKPSVVFIHAQDEHGRNSYGSGMVIDDRLVLTAGHIVDDANNVCVEFDNGIKIKSTTFFKVRQIDVGLIIINVGDRPTLLFGDSVDIGNDVFTIGSPFKKKNSVGAGILSAYDRDVEGERLHQLDLNVNPGMSGCPVFNRYGRVIGMITRGRYGLGFMVPSETCKFVIGVYENVQKTQIK